MATAFTQRHRWTYDVFVSFKGEDIRKSFMDHLFQHFEQKGIHVFRDDKDLTLGEKISPNLDKVIEESRFLIVVFSKNYASSSWCLRELVKILACKQLEDHKHEVRIIFYDVKPDVVRKQTGSYVEAFAKHEISNRTEVVKWKEALVAAADLSGWDLEDMANGYEYKFISNISEEILKALAHEPLHVGENLVGVDAHVNEMNLLRFVGSDKVHMIGICGISGIGKTTLAKAIYNSMSIHFEKCSFCEDVEGIAKQQGLTRVQMQLIGKLMKTRVVEISSVSEGIMVIKKTMPTTPILLVLDDVDHRDQLEALAGSPDWFFPGSLIIFTGKDKQLLRSHKVDEVYDMPVLQDYKALELFSLYAFGKNHPNEDFIGLSNHVLDCLQGHPLALRVLGGSLYQKPMHVWKSEVDRLQIYPHADIQQKLRPSYDGLDFNEKRIFLDIACSLIGENEDIVASVLGNKNSLAYAEMEVLVNKSLLTISLDDNSLQMHELIRCMARRIIDEEFVVQKVCSRLWNLSEVCNVLSKKKAIEAVEVLDLLLKESTENIHIDSDAFEDMKNLRILKICDAKHKNSRYPSAIRLKDYKVTYSRRLKSLSNKLRLLYWHGCPFELPSDFYPKNIVAIDLSYSHLKTLWTIPKSFGMMKVMKLRHCRNLTSTPDFTRITNLKELNLEGCVNLVKVHPSFGMLKKLVVLNMRDCKSFRRFPYRVEMDSLQVMNLSGCSKVDKLPEFFSNIMTLKEISIDGTAIPKLPSFVLSQCNLQVLKLGGREEKRCRWWTSISQPSWLPTKMQHPRSLVMPSLAGLCSLQELNLSHCNMLEVSNSIESLSCLRSLYLQGNNFTSFPAGCLSKLPRLLSLELSGCKKLEVLPELPPSLIRLYASDCTSLCQLPPNNNHKVFSSLRMFLDGCPKLFRNPIIESQVCMSQPLPGINSSITSHSFRSQISSFLQFTESPSSTCGFFTRQERQFYDSQRLDISYHGDRIPQWFTTISMKNRIQVQLPPNFCYTKLRGYGICVVVTPKTLYGHKCSNYKLNTPRYYVNNFDGTSFGCQYGFLYHSTTSPKSDVIWFCFLTSVNHQWREAKNFVSFSIEDLGDDFEVKECGVRLVFDENIREETDFNITRDLPTPTHDGGGIRIIRNNHFFVWSW